MEDEIQAVEEEVSTPEEADVAPEAEETTETTGE